MKYGQFCAKIHLFAPFYIAIAVGTLNAAVQYEINGLPAPPTAMGSNFFTGSYAKSINASEQIVFDAFYQATGSAESPIGPVISVPMIYQGGQYTLLPIPTSSGTSAQAVGINASGSVGGSAWSTSQAGIQKPIIWTAGIANPMALDSYTSGILYAINDSGEAGGIVTSGESTDPGHAAWWDQNGTLHDLGTFGGLSADVRAINNNGQMLIDVDFGDHSDALLLDHGNAQIMTGATLLNNNGHVIFDGQTVGGFPQYSFWNGSTSIILPHLVGDLSGLYIGLNDSDQAVGTSTSFGSELDRAILWDNGALYDLNSLVQPNSGWVLTGASAIASDGTIVGTGYLNGQFNFFLATPSAFATPALVPEPATASTLLFGGMFLLRRSRRRN